jgi:hypothetical protein
VLHIVDKEQRNPRSRQSPGARLRSPFPTLAREIDVAAPPLPATRSLASSSPRQQLDSGEVGWGYEGRRRARWGLFVLVT